MSEKEFELRFYTEEEIKELIKSKEEWKILIIGFICIQKTTKIISKIITQEVIDHILNLELKKKSKIDLRKGRNIYEYNARLWRITKHYWT